MPTPVSGRGDKRPPLFPFATTPSPVEYTHSVGSPCISFARTISRNRAHSRRRSSSSQSTQSLFDFKMHAESYSNRYAPTSPLSPRLPSNQRPMSPQPSASRSRAGHRRQPSRNTQNNLGRYYPGNPANSEIGQELPRSTNPNDARHRPPQSLEMMRERQRELIARARTNSKIAASPMGVKPDSPRLEPLGSPKGAVTPLALEDAADYFSGAIAGGVSPARSPGPKPEGSDKEDEESVSQKQQISFTQ